MSNFFQNPLDKSQKLCYNVHVAGIAQSVEQLIRNEQVISSSLITSFHKSLCFLFGNTGFFILHSDDDTRKMLERDIKELRKTIGQERFPQVTNNSVDAIRDYEFRLCYELKEMISFRIKDYSGEALEARDEVYQEVKQSIAESTALYIFINGESFCADDREERKENVYYDCAMTLCPMIQDFADTHEEALPPVIFVVTKTDLFKNYISESEMISVIKSLFRPAFSENTISYICGVSLGANISDDNYKGKLDPFNIQLPIFIGSYHEFYDRIKNPRHHKTKAEKAEEEKLFLKFGAYLEDESENFCYFTDGKQSEFRAFNLLEAKR